VTTKAGLLAQHEKFVGSEGKRVLKFLLKCSRLNYDLRDRSYNVT